MTSETIRLATAPDAEAVFRLLTAFVVSYAPDRSAFDTNFPLLLQDPNALLLVATRDGRAIGYALAFHLRTLYANGFVTELQELMVEDASRGQGVGRQLVRAVFEKAQERGASEVTVPTRRAGDYYRRLGFQETATYFKHKLANLEKPS